jgi:hypothetical protein
MKETRYHSRLAASGDGNTACMVFGARLTAAHLIKGGSEGRAH